MQRHLHVTGGIDQIEVATYLKTLCGSLSSSMTGESQPIDIKVTAQNGRIGSDQAVSLGLIVTELVINAIKYAFSALKAGASISVSYEVNGADWKLVFADNGVGKEVVPVPKPGGGWGRPSSRRWSSRLRRRWRRNPAPAARVVHARHLHLNACLQQLRALSMSFVRSWAPSAKRCLRGLNVSYLLRDKLPSLPIKYSGGDCI
ncbi:sensor histidine kinase [Rhizobium sp. PL01]|uniref:sensor histidine kinase n=1 Tax=Rhizobium sp. PL01 TaxID=3085631 RepID=UPI0029812AA0|nr:sensor histidine kinase [Rhizobium sp. PL01]MDW5312910.1 sensor histidine kinase [Rhizobium sp. PL01]